MLEIAQGKHKTVEGATPLGGGQGRGEGPSSQDSM